MRWDDAPSHEGRRPRPRPPSVPLIGTLRRRILGAAGRGGDATTTATRRALDEENFLSQRRDACATRSATRGARMGEITGG